MSATWGAQEFAQAQVWDRRCARSLGRMAEALAEHHGLSFSAACGNALRQAAHRIFEHSTLSVPGLLAGHYAETARRIARDAGDTPLLIAQDTTELNYAGHLADPSLGYLSGKNPARGLLAHTALAVSTTGVPLGLLHAQLWARDFAERGKKHQRTQRRTEEKESQKWLDALVGIEAVLPPGQVCLVLADREADFFDYFAAPRRPETHLLVRAHQPRRVERCVEDAVAAAAGEEAEETDETEEAGVTELWAAVAARPAVGEHVVALPARPGQAARKAQLTLRWVQLRMLVPRDYRRRQPKDQPPPQPLTVWVIEAREESPPAGATPVHWVLLTTWPVENAADCVRLLGYYTQRWTIERLHYTLKQGLRVERLQIDDAVSLQHALAVCFVVAWYLLWVTHLARVDPEGPATDLLTPEELPILAAAAQRPIRTRREVVRALAQLGGFPGHPKAGEPGVKTLWLGWTRFTSMVEGWRLYQAAATYATR